MDYEKAYKESFEAAKGLYDAGNALTKKQTEIVFPQLAESEDEDTMRKELKRRIKWLTNELQAMKELIDSDAWLEKQKELFKSGRGLYYYDGEKTVYMGCHATEENPYDFAMSQQEEKKEPHFTKRNALFDKCVENCDPKTVEEVNKRVDDIMNMPELSAFEQALTNFICDWEDDEERWADKFVKKHGKHILDMAREELKKEQKPILEVFGFKVGDAVRLKDGDGRKHIIKSFEEVEGLHGPNFYHVEFEDNSARDSIYPGEEYPNGYYTNMDKIDEPKDPFDDEQFRRGYEAGKNDAEREINTQLIHWQERAYEEMMKERFPDYGIKVTTNDNVSELKASGDVYENIHNAMDQKPAEWSEEDRLHYANVLEALEYVKGCKSDYDKIEAVKSDIAWLKLLRNRVGKEFLQPHWKPSEEEVRLINTSISFLKDLADKGYENAVECIDWLKSKLNGNSGK